MTKEAFLKFVEQEKIPDWYFIILDQKGMTGARNDQYVVELNKDDKYEVYYYERGSKHGCVTYDSLEDALDYLYMELNRSRSTSYHDEKQSSHRTLRVLLISAGYLILLWISPVLC